MLAIYTVLLLLSLYVPLIGSVAFFLLPLPVMMYSAKHPLPQALFLFVGVILISGLLGGILTLPLAFAIGTTGIVIGWGIKAKFDKMRLLMASSLTLLLNIVVWYAISIAFFNMNIVEDSLEQSKTMYHSLFEKLGQQPDKEIIDSLESSVSLIQTLMPTLFLGMAVFLALFFMIINFPIMKRLGVDVPAFQPFREWKLPKSILWYYLVTLVLTIVLQPEKGTYIYTALINVLYVLQSLMAVQGLSFLYFYSYTKGWSKGILILITIISIPLLYLVRILGIIDLGFDLRQRLQRKS